MFDRRRKKGLKTEDLFFPDYIAFRCLLVSFPPPPSTKAELHEVGMSCCYVSFTDFFVIGLRYRAWEVVWFEIPHGLCSRHVLSLFGLLLLFWWSTNYFQLAAVWHGFFLILHTMSSLADII